MAVHVMRRVPSSLIQTPLKLIESSIYWAQNHDSSPSPSRARDTHKESRL